MNVTFHTLASIATAAFLSLRPAQNSLQGITSGSAFAKYAIGFTAGILAHGILDYAPHEYPFYAKFDVPFALLLFMVTFFLVQPQNRLLLATCFVGALFPDLLDLGPAILNKNFGFPYFGLSYKVFPWHWKEFSGSLYEPSRRVESMLYHIILLLICTVALYLNKNRFFKLAR
jgi:hypothetical protein